MTIGLDEYLSLPHRDKRMLVRALNEYIQDLNENGGGTITNKPPRRER